ncbi:MAG: fibronectin type III domain-containing protein [Minicystis sp.]
MSTSTRSAPVAALMIPRSVALLITFAKAVHDHMLNNPNFPSPSPTLDVFAADIAALADAETKAATKAKGTAALRDARAKKVKDDLFHLLDYVQSIVEQQATPKEGAAIIESAFMSVRKTSKRTRPPLAVKNTGVSGRVVAEAKAVDTVATYYWEYSLDQQTWTTVPETMRASTVISGLKAAQTYYFRFRALTRTSEIGYSQVVSLLVH